MKHWKNGRKLLCVIVCAVLCIGALAACAGEDPAPQDGGPQNDPAPAPQSGGSVIGNLPENSILLFQNDEGAAKLNRDMAEGRIPVACNVLYDTMGARPDVTVEDPEIITELYERLGRMTVTGESGYSITDSYHHIIFQLQDGTYVGYHFEGVDNLCWGYDNYAAVDNGNLWTLVYQLQEEYMSKDENDNL
ncbi:MAG: hypothetical protein IJH91_04730 [Mogibacterium sp.]|nr:hypothetical protein [Mogibacterium sp.]